MDVEIQVLNIEFYSLNRPIVYEGVECGHDQVICGLPSYATEGSAGLDLKTTKDLIMLPNCTQLIDTGLAIWIKDPGVAAVIIPRSGLGHKEGLILGNTAGLIDSDYQGPLKVSLWNRTEVVRYYSAGDRIAQMIFIPVLRPTLKLVGAFSNVTDRGIGGYGSSGIK